MRKILEAAALRSKTVEAFGEVFVCHEMTAGTSMEFSTRYKEDKADALAFIFENQVKTEDGKPAFKPSEALTIAKGNAAVGLQLWVAISGFGDPEKKASSPRSDSATDSPSVSDAQSPN